METVCLYFDLDSDGTVQGAQRFAWDDPYDRQGDGEQEAEHFLECTRDNGFDIARVDLAVSGADLPAGTAVYRADDGRETTWFALAVVPVREA